MNIKNNALLFFLLASFSVLAKDYRASLFGIYSDGKTLNTTAIQFAVNYINANGGGRLVFNVGRYLTGTINLKSNVTLHFDEGAVLLGSANPFDYEKRIESCCYALVVAYDQENIGITGKGILDGQGVTVARNIVEHIEKGLIKDSYTHGRPSERPMLVYFKRCKDIKIIDMAYKNSAFWTQTYDQCKNLRIDGINVDNTTYWNQDGIDIVDCDNVSITNCYIDAADDGICLKSHDDNSFCNNVYIHNNKIRTSANGIKFGTASRGGFRNIKITKNTVFDTYRSAVALEAVDGGFLENVEIDSLQVYNTGNLIYLTIGERTKHTGKKSTLNNIKISNVYAEIPATKPDTAYGYEGPTEDQPRNVSPAIIIKGLPGSRISDVVFKNFEVRHAGGGNAKFANVPLSQIESIPELPAQYPEFSMFKELPAWGVYIRHASGIQFSNMNMKTEKNDFRVPVVLDDVTKSKFSDLKFNGKFKKQDFFQNKSAEIEVK